ncbi:hypothetical protein [Flavicella sediminum]|uniref:hypothetical protein n=1 Tax=Flavicella sediminum TaxID=2585141 RepID=UPI00111CB568|nr:hypothetical protein [Flavicella sediminum]
MKKNISAFILILSSIFMINCSKDDGNKFFLTVVAKHSSYKSIESTFATLSVIIDESDFSDDSNISHSQTTSGSYYSLIPIEGAFAGSNIKTGESRTLSYVFNSNSDIIDLKLKVNERKTIDIKDISSNSKINWDFANDYATVSKEQDDEAGENDNDEKCKDWVYYNTECLSSVSDGTGSSKAGIRSRVCRLSETNTDITIRTEIEAINGGIDNINFYKGIKIYYGDGSVASISKEEFNKKGKIIKEYTAKKSSINTQDNKDYDELSSGYYMIVTCENN